MKKKSIILSLVAFLAIFLLVSFFYIQNGGKKTENQAPQEVVVEEELELEEAESEAQEEHTPYYLINKYGRTYDGDTHILTFYIDGEKVNEVNIFEVAPITMEGRENLGPRERPEGLLGYFNTDDKYSILPGDNERFGIDEEIDYITLSIGPGYYHLSKYVVVNYHFNLYYGNNLIDVVHRAFILGQGGNLERELVLEKEVSLIHDFYVDSIHPDMKYMIYTKLWGIDSDELTRYVTHIDDMEKDFLKDILKDSGYEYYHHNRILFNNEGKVILEHNEVKNLDQGCLELDFDLMEIKLLENC